MGGIMKHMLDALHMEQAKPVAAQSKAQAEDLARAKTQVMPMQDRSRPTSVLAGGNDPASATDPTRRPAPKTLLGA